MLRKQFGMFLEFLFALTANKTNFKLAGEKIENYIHALKRMLVVMGTYAFPVKSKHL
ncbi:MAG: hypothetical protein RR185_03935 [Angelakisella sp.]